MQQDGADLVACQMEDQGLAAIVEEDDLVHARRGQAGNPGDAVAHGDHPALLRQAQAEGDSP